MKLLQHPDVNEVLKKYPEKVKTKLLQLRSLIIRVASDDFKINQLEETLKWGEPSYKSKKGSTIRINEVKSRPNSYAMYFTCTTNLIDTFKLIYPDKFEFEGNRAMIFDIYNPIPVAELKHCISLALNYHSIKHLPLLGALP